MTGFFRKLSQLVRHDRLPSQKKAKLAFEHLEDRLVPANLDYTALVQSLPGYPHIGSTRLALNFDGDGNNGAVAFAGTSRDIQEILYRTSEIFAPFNVQVGRITGNGVADTTNPGATTIFVGDNTQDTILGANMFGGFTPSDSADDPGSAKGTTHAPNSDAHDIAFVDPVSDFGNADNVWISEAIAHEAGHTFGLVHVRTDGLTDPTALGAPSAYQKPDIMTYNLPDQYFADATDTITNMNYNPSTGTSTVVSSLQPQWTGSDGATNNITTQDSFTYLQRVLGPHPADGQFHVSDSNTVDPGVLAQFRPAAANFTLGSSVTGNITRPGDFNVFAVQAGASKSFTIDVVPSSANPGFVPYVQVYDSTGAARIISYDSTVNPTTGRSEIHTTFASSAYSFVYVVVGTRDSGTMGQYTLTLKGPPPVANNDGYTMTVGATLAPKATDGVLHNDVDPDHLTMTAQKLTDPKHGSVILFADGSFSYSPNAFYYGTDSFTYRVTDANGVSAPATVSIKINPYAPTAQNLSYNVLENQPLSVPVTTGLVYRNLDPQNLAMQVHLTQNPRFGTVNLNADGSFVYTPNAGYLGTDSFQYAVSDSLFTSSPGTVSLVVGQIPVAANLVYFVPLNSTSWTFSAASGLVASNLPANAQAHLVQRTQHGAITVNLDGSFTYVPNHGYRGKDYFSYELINSYGISNIGVVEIDVGVTS